MIGIGSTSGSTLGAVAETANANNSYLNNSITKCRYGLGVVGPSAGETGTVIADNYLGSTIATSKIGFKAMFVSNQTNFTVNNNTVAGVSGTDAASTNGTAGITLVGAISGGEIKANTIFDIKNTNTLGWTSNGITLASSSASTGTKIYNNFIYDITGFGYTFNITDNGHGMEVISGGGYDIQYNSIHLATNQGQAGNPVGLYIGTATITGLNIRNNIFSITQSLGTRFAIYCQQTNAVFADINYNDYFSSGTLGFLGAAQTTLANWQAATGKDGNSVVANPVFITPTNLHLQPSSPLNATGTPIVGITRDIDGDTRDVSTPDIGADEIFPSPCTPAAVSGGTISAALSPICASQSTTLSAVNYPFGLGMTYQWEYDNGGGFLPLAGETTPYLANVSGLTANTVFRLRNICGAASGLSSNTVTIFVNNPQVLSTGAGPASCGVGTVNLTANAGGALLNWYDVPTGGSTLYVGSPFTTPTISTSTNFYVSASIQGSTVAGGKPSTTGPDGGYTGTDAGVVFDANVPFKIISVLMYPQGASQVTIEARTSAGALIPGCQWTENFTGATSTGVVVPINFSIPVGVSHRLIVSGNNTSTPIWRDFSPNAFPYTLGAVGSITSGYITGVSSAYYFFYDWKVADVWKVPEQLYWPRFQIHRHLHL